MKQEKSESPYYLLLTLAFVSLFLHSAFFNDGTMFAQVLEKIPESTISSIEQFLNPPFSKFSQSWVFDDINFVIIVLIKNLGYLLGWYDTNQLGNYYLYDFSGVFRLTSFIAGFASCVLFFNLSKLLFKSELIAFLGTLLFMLHPIGSLFFYSVHPENMGMVFALIAILYLVKFTTAQNYHYFYISYLSLVLAILTKPVFAFVLVPVLFSFFLSYCHGNGISYSGMLLSRKFAKILLYTFGIAISVTLLVHPHIIFEFYNVYGEQQMIDSVQPSFANLLSSPVWLFDYQNDSLINLNMIVLVAVIFYLIFTKINSLNILFLTSLLYCNLFIVFIIYGSNSPVSLNVLYPILPLLILNIMATITFTLELLSSLVYSKYLKFSLALLLGIYFSPVFLTNILAITAANGMLNKLAYNTTQYQSKRFIIGDIPVNSSIVHDPSIPMPNLYNKTCTFWVCSINSKTDFVILQQDSVHAGEQDFLNINHLVFPTTTYIQKLSNEESYFDERYALGSQFKLIKKIQANIPLNFSINDSFSGMQELFSGSNCTSSTEPESVGTSILVYRNQATAMTKSEKTLERTIQHVAKMADLFYKLGNLEGAKEQYLKHLELSESIDDSTAIMVDKTILIDIYEKQKHLAKVLELVNQLIPMTLLSLELDSSYSKLEYLYRKRYLLNQQLNNQEESDRDYIKLAEFYVNCYFSKERECIDALKKNLPDLLVRIEQAYLKKIEVLSRGPNYTEQFLAADYSVLGQFYTSINNWEKSISIYKKTIGIYDSLGDKSGLFNAYSALAATYGMASSSAEPELDEDTTSVGIGLEENMRQELNTRLQMIDLCKTMTIVSCDLTRLKNEYQNVLLLHQLLGDEAQARKIETDLNLIEKQ